mmetsp:Transcript_3188/g.4923  ORF Transcript_3188/g.4923 Transcript_3188/m.4923 type:complete len:959 (+) Transcript_3188:172-3048(+)
MGNAPCHASREDLLEQKKDTIVVKKRRYLAEDGVVPMVEDLQFKLYKAEKKLYYHEDNEELLQKKIRDLEDELGALKGLPAKRKPTTSKIHDSSFTREGSAIQSMPARTSKTFLLQQNEGGGRMPERALSEKNNSLLRSPLYHRRSHTPPPKSSASVKAKLKKKFMRRSSCFLYKSKQLDDNSVWQTELAPRRMFSVTLKEMETKKEKKEKASRRRSLAVYVNYGENTELEIKLGDENADKYVHVKPVYAFKKPVPSPSSSSSNNNNNNAHDNAFLETPSSGSSKPQKNLEIPSSRNPVLGDKRKVPQAAGKTSKASWLVVSIGEDGLCTSSTVSDDAFRRTYSEVDEGLHQYAQVLSVHAVVLKYEAKLQVQQLDSYGNVIQTKTAKTNEVPTLSNSTQFTVLSLNRFDSQQSGVHTPRDSLSMEAHHEIKGLPGDYLVQDSHGNQWFVKGDVFASCYQPEIQYARQKVMRRSYHNLQVKPFHRFRKNLWSLRKPRKLLPDGPPTRPIANHLKNVLEWSFDIFGLSNVTGKKPLYHTGYEVFRRYRLFESMQIDQTLFKQFLVQVEMTYLDNPYHNSMHGGDVCQASAHFLTAIRQAFPCRNAFPLGFSALEVTALLLAGLVHDIGHPGTNNAFQIASASSLALYYNDRSVLESFHASEAFAILQQPQYNFLRQLPASEYQSLRYIVIELVLATDLEKHREFISSFEKLWEETRERLEEEYSASNSTRNSESKSPVGTPDSPRSSKKTDRSGHSAAGGLAMHSAPTAHSIMREIVKTPEGRLMVMKLIIKCSDINHPSRPTFLHKKWCELIQEEFFLQGEKEEELGFPISRGMDRKTATKKSVANGNCGFIQFIVNPLFELMKTKGNSPQFSRNIDINLSYWQKMAAEAKEGEPLISPREKEEKEKGESKTGNRRVRRKHRRSRSPRSINISIISGEGGGKEANLELSETMNNIPKR